jgi:hypothetical protein
MREIFSDGRDKLEHKYTDSRGSPVNNIQTAGILQSTIVRQQGCIGTNYTSSRDVPVNDSYTAWVFQAKWFKQHGYPSQQQLSSKGAS